MNAHGWDIRGVIVKRASDLSAETTTFSVTVVFKRSQPMPAHRPRIAASRFGLSPPDRSAPLHTARLSLFVGLSVVCLSRLSLRLPWFRLGSAPRVCLFVCLSVCLPVSQPENDATPDFRVEHARCLAV